MAFNCSTAGEEGIFCRYKAEFSTGTPSERGPSILPMPAKGGPKWDRAAAGSLCPREPSAARSTSSSESKYAHNSLHKEPSRRLQRWKCGQCPNVTSQPCCRPPVAQRASCACSLTGASVLPVRSPRSPCLAHGMVLPSSGSGRSSASPPLAQAFALTLGQELCQGSLQQGPPALGHAAEIALEIWWWLCRPHPQSLGIISSSSLISADMIWPIAAQGTPEQDC